MAKILYPDLEYNLETAWEKVKKGIGGEVDEGINN